MKLGMIAPSHDAEGIKKVASYGLHYAEFDINADDIHYIDYDSVLAAMQQYDVKMGAVGRWGRNRILSDGSVNKKEQQDEFELIDACVKLGCPVYCTGCNYNANLSYYSNVTAAINYFESLIAYADGRVKICTYNCDWNSFVNKPHEWDIIHDHIKALGIKFDPSHTINGGRDYLSEAAKYAGNFDHVHLKGTLNIDGVHVDDPPAGLDSINWGAFFSILYKNHYQGMLSIEPHSATWQGELGEKGIKYTIEYMNKLLFND